MKQRISAQEILDKYGVTSPGEIDLEAIAYCENAEVRYQNIEGSEARLMGIGNRAIITIDSKSDHSRQRFSLAHELGHWIGDRGTVGKLCKREVIGPNQTNSKINWTEVAANKFASELLMPMFLFKESSFRESITFETVDSLKIEYQTSLMATALRLIETDNCPCALVFSISKQIKWMKKSNSVPDSFWYRSSIGENTLAANLQSGMETGNVLSSEWFSTPGVDAEDYFILESSTVYRNGILTLLWWEDESQILNFT